MMRPANHPASPDEISWLSQVREVSHPLTPVRPIIVRRTGRKSGAPLEPTVPYPEEHPYCELGWSSEGSALHFIGPEKIRRTAGSALLLGPGVPHYAKVLKYPTRGFSVHFLPVLLLEMGPVGDGAHLLSWMVNVRDYRHCIHQIPPARQREVGGLFEAMAVEQERRQVGSELRLRALLMDLLVLLLRRSQPAARPVPPPAEAPNWEALRRAFRFIHERYAEDIYTAEIAAAAGVHESRLQAMFRETVGMSPVTYLAAYRITQAKALLCLPGARIIEVADRVGFHTLSHFNRLFRKLAGVSPSEYARARGHKGAGSPPAPRPPPAPARACGTAPNTPP